MANFLQDARHIDFAPAAETAVGALVAVGGTIGIVDPTNHGGPLAAGELGSLAVRCAVEIDNSGVVFAFGDTVGYSEANDNAVAAAGGDFDCGVAIAAAGATDKVRVLLTV